jgi:methyl-accepting chemotaxis protein
MTHDEVKRLTWRIFLLQQVNQVTTTPFSLYVMGSITALPGDQVMWLLTRVLPIPLLIFGVGGPVWAIRSSLMLGLPRPEDKPGDRLSRLLRISRVMERRILMFYVAGAAMYLAGASFFFGKSWWDVLWGSANIFVLSSLIMIWTRVFIERMLHPHIQAEFHKYPQVTPTGSGYDWPRLRWYLPYAFALFVTTTLVMSLTIIFVKARQTFAAIAAKLTELGLSQHIDAVLASALQVANESTLPLAALTLFLLVSAFLSAWFLARQQKDGAEAVQNSLQSLISGKPEMPKWASTDEIGDLAFATARAFEQLKAFTISLKDSAVQLGQSAEQLNAFNTKQSEVMSLQAAALQETQVTAQEIKQTSLLASQKAETVLQKVEQADQVSRSGEVAIERSMGGLKDIRGHVTEMAVRIKALEERARQIGHITQTVKDLADQSNMLALNAAIEAVRSGEAGKGFGVVAREIRSLADQSIKATTHVREILQDISAAIRATVQITEKGAEKIETSLEDINAFSENIRQLSGIVRDNAAAVRQISGAVTQQNTGISQIFQAVNDLSRMMDETMNRLKATGSATETLGSVAQNVSNFVNGYNWEAEQKQQAQARALASTPPKV